MVELFVSTVFFGMYALSLVFQDKDSLSMIPLLTQSFAPAFAGLLLGALLCQNLGKVWMRQGAFIGFIGGVAFMGTRQISGDPLSVMMNVIKDTTIVALVVIFPLIIIELIGRWFSARGDSEKTLSALVFPARTVVVLFIVAFCYEHMMRYIFGIL